MRELHDFFRECIESGSVVYRLPVMREHQGALKLSVYLKGGLLYKFEKGYFREKLASAKSHSVDKQPPDRVCIELHLPMSSFDEVDRLHSVLTSAYRAYKRSK